MSQQHIEALATLANMHYIASQLHARTPVVDSDGSSIVNHMDTATKHLNDSMLKSNSGDSQGSLFSLRRSYQHTHGVLQMLMTAGEDQIERAKRGELSPDTVLTNMADMNSFVNHHEDFLNKGTEIVANQQKKGLDQRDLQDNAREVIEGIADDKNLLLPGSWVNRGDGKAPNGE
jgi:hypothetical protein